jgi:hypothetical protein
VSFQHNFGLVLPEPRMAASHAPMQPEVSRGYAILRGRTGTKLGQNWLAILSKENDHPSNLNFNRIVGI